MKDGQTPTHAMMNLAKTFGKRAACLSAFALWTVLLPGAGTPSAQGADSVLPPLSRPLGFGLGTNYSTSLTGYVPDDKYKLRVGDKVSFQIIEDREAPKSIVVADSGELDVPYIGRIPAAEKTCKQLAEELKTALEKEYYYRATVVLALDQANKLLGSVYVWGQVRNQGRIEMAVNENLTAGKAILRAGGFADFANKKKVKVVRGGTGTSEKEIFELNMVEILEQGKTEKDILLKPDDVVIVSDRPFNF